MNLSRDRHICIILPSNAALQLPAKTFRFRKHPASADEGVPVSRTVRIALTAVTVVHRGGGGIFLVSPKPRGPTLVRPRMGE